MEGWVKVGVFSSNDPRPWVREGNIELMLKHEESLVKALKEAGVDVIHGGEGYPRMDQIAWNTRLVQEHVAKIARGKPEVLIVNEGSWTFPYDSIDAVKYFEAETGDIAKVIIFSHKDPTVPGLVAGMAVGGGLKRIGVPYTLIYGNIEKDPKVKESLTSALRFYKRRVDSACKVKEVIFKLRYQKYLALGGMSLRMPTTTADVDQWQKLFGVSYEALDQSELLVKAGGMVRWDGKPGESSFQILDKRLEEALNFIWRQGHGIFDFSKPSLKGIEKLVYQLALYYSALDIADEYSITFMGVKCQDELSARHCTACILSAFMNNDVGPDGKPKPVIPTACENDMDSALTQLILHLISGKPAGFGDFRDLEEGLLTIMNCGQHPPYFFGKPEEDSIAKLNRTEYIGQEVYYAAGGSAVRGRTPGGLDVTIARLARENLRYQLIATVIETVGVDPSEHERYTPSWPIIKGKIPIPDELLINLWPCNHLAFTFGDLTAELVELAHRMGIGYRIFVKDGKEYFKPT